MDARVTALSGRLLAGDIRRLAARQMMPLSFSIGLLLLLWDKLAGVDISGIWSGIDDVTLWQWGIAACLTIASFWAVGRYDAVVHRMIGTDIAPQAATRSGATAIAVAQTVGFGVISGAFVRWRMLPNLSFFGALKISAIVSITFLSGWACVTAIAILISPTALPLPGISLFAVGVLAAGTALIAVSLVFPHLSKRLRLPPLKAMAAIVALALADTVMAAGAFYILLPASIGVDLLTFTTVFLLALGAGLISGTPGGVGPFEITLLALLPQYDAQELLTAIVAFRLVYYAVPALIGALLAIRGPGKATYHAGQQILNPMQDLPQQALENLIKSAPGSEAALLRQGRLSLLAGHKMPSAMVMASNQSLVMLRDALDRTTKPERVLDDLSQTAKTRFLSPSLYKAPPRLALSARRAGWQVLPISAEAFIRPHSYNTEGRAYRQLRRKLRSAKAKGVTITKATGPLPLAEMAQINAEWTHRRGGERGFSMGVWSPDTIQFDKVFLAWDNEKLLGFLTLHQNPREQVLDLMRYGKDAPDGMMQMLLDFAIRDAADAGVERLSLASVPIDAQAHESPFFGYLRTYLGRVSGAGGLRQFKASFAPQWQTLYMAAPTRLGLTLAALDIGHEITRQ